MKKSLSKFVSHLLTILIVVQAVLCFILMFRAAVDKDMAIFGYRFYYIVSPSMEPAIGTGAEIVVKEVETDTLEIGDIITFDSRDPAIQGYPNTHRIVEITTDTAGNPAFVTKGDNNPMADSYLVYPEDIYGEVVAVTPAFKGLIQFYSFAATPPGFMVVVVMPLLLVFGTFFHAFIQEMKVSTAELSETEEEMTEDQMQEMIAAVVQNYIKEHPDQPITAEEALALASGLIEANRKKGEEKGHGKP